MKTIVVVEDVRSVALAMKRALDGLGHLSAATRIGPMGGMPPINQIKRSIRMGDLIILGYRYGRETPYTGDDLVAHCAGKKIIVTAPLMLLPGAVQFDEKSRLIDDPEVARQFRALVAQVLMQ